MGSPAVTWWRVVVLAAVVGSVTSYLVQFLLGVILAHWCPC